MHPADNDRRVYSGEAETAEHPFFQYQRWESTWHRLQLLVGKKVYLDNFLEIMLKSNENLKIVQRSAEEILKTKVKDEKRGHENIKTDLEIHSQQDGTRSV